MHKWSAASDEHERSRASKTSLAAAQGAQYRVTCAAGLQQGASHCVPLQVSARMACVRVCVHMQTHLDARIAALS
jgi:hypothetical protein